MKKQFIFSVVSGVIFFGAGFTNSVFAAVEPVDITSLGDDVGASVTVNGANTVGGATIETPDQVSAALLLAAGGAVAASVTITPSDLGVDHVGILPISKFYFLKQCGRGITRLFTFGSINKTQLELNITNQIAAEVLEVGNGFFPGGVNVPGVNVKVLTKAFQAYTNAQGRLNLRLSTLTETSSNSKVAKLLTDVDAKTTKHVALLEQLTTKGNSIYGDVVWGIIKEAQNNTQKIFTVTVEKDADVKQKAVDGIARVEEATKQTETTIFGQPVTITAAVISTVNGGKNGEFDGQASIQAEGGLITTQLTFKFAMAPSGGEADPEAPTLFLACANGQHIKEAELLTTAPSPAGDEADSGVSTQCATGKHFKESVGSSTAVTPIPGVDVIVKKNPSGIPITVSTDQNGSYTFTGLEPGTYDLSIAGVHVPEPVNVDAAGILDVRVQSPFKDFASNSAMQQVSTSRSLKTDTDSGDAVDRWVMPDDWAVSIVREIANAKSDLQKSKDLFAEGKYSEAYGQARFAETMIVGIGTILNDDASFQAIVPIGDTTQETDETFSETIIPTPVGDLIPETDETFSVEQEDEPESENTDTSQPSAEDESTATEPESDDAEVPQSPGSESTTDDSDSTEPESAEPDSAEPESTEADSPEPITETVTIMTSSLNPSTSNESVTFTATVTGDVTPTGSVTFSIGLATLGVGTLDDSGVATFTTSSLANQTHDITATYSGDETHSGSTSSTFSQVVNDSSSPITEPESEDTEPSSDEAGGRG